MKRRRTCCPSDGLPESKVSTSDKHKPAAPLHDAASVTQGQGELPRHVAVIMDGNNRWSRRQGGKELDGHVAGAEAARRLIRLCATHGIPWLTLFAFSSENWQRPQKEVSGLMDLFARFLQKKEVQQLHENGVCLRFIGNRSRFSASLRQQMASAENLTADNARLCVIVAADYGGRWDITQAARQLALEVEAGRMRAGDIDEAAMQAHLAAADLPPPDLCIRTGGEFRISNFLLWQLAYAELYFTPTLWPDFDEAAFELALADYAGRQRRFGRVSEQVSRSGHAGS